jgi:[NiFe] hydrogenase assembly HybE family chaperone
MEEIAALCALVEETFERIQKERMQDVPILNEKLSVAAVGLREHVMGGKPAFVGCLVTPWFINLFAIAASPEADGITDDAAVTQTVQLLFPSGSYPFLVCEEEALGRFAMCSLFSPVHEFEDQQAARAVAAAAVEELFDGDRDQTPSDEEVAVATMWQEGRWVTPSEPETANASLKDDPAPSRRAIITAGLASGEASE